MLIFYQEIKPYLVLEKMEEYLSLMYYSFGHKNSFCQWGKASNP